MAIYTAIYGDYDEVPEVPDEGVECWLLGDNTDVLYRASQRGWNTGFRNHGIATTHGDPARVAPMLAHKWWKLHPQLAVEADVSIWMDASMTVTVDRYVERCLDALGEDDCAFVAHPERTCIYPEADYSATLQWRYDAPSILAQAAHYRAFHPEDWGLFATGNIVRRHTSTVERLGQLWWDENIAWSHQDQLSLPVLVRLAEDLTWNTNIPWHQWWSLGEHKR